MQHEVQCICSVPKPLNTEFETTVTFVNRDGKPGNYVNCYSGTRSHYIADAPLLCNCLTIILRQDYMMVALHTLPILILIITPITEPIQKIILDAIVYKRKTHLLQKVKQ
jgi:hypothetical protein